MMSRRQIKGIIAIAFCLAVIPFFRFMCPTPKAWHGPTLSSSGKNKLAVEIIAQQGLSGIYFVEKEFTLQDLLQRAEIKNNIDINYSLQNAMTLRLTNHDHPQKAVLEKMAADKRLALGLPLDINLATYDDLLMVPGVGVVMAEKILLRRNEIGRFTNLNQLMEISGIKENKLLKLIPYLCIE